MSLSRPFANLLSQNEWLNYILSFAFSEKREWRPSTLHSLAKSLHCFPISEDDSYTFRVMKNLADKGILQTVKIWRERPILLYRLTDIGEVHFYSGDHSVQKNITASLRSIQKFLNDIEGHLHSSGHVTEEKGPRGYLSLRDYYEWLLLQGTSMENSPSQILGAANKQYGKTVKKSYFYQVYKELQPDFVNESKLTILGQERLLVLEQTLLHEVGSVKQSIHEMLGINRQVKRWVKTYQSEQD
ncbi:hypothetical protein [Brevibacillus laterosporus]|uniref:Uncharacterized protein n=1 Tax=Brevibacillus laterosporus TaxID=1465 RepID=A0AAP3DKB9_BRELA|nr:hypothetical protein [Brevibacillus laterosporus]MCR8982431.1 hypothetical protein [Brevibacillus laterosporus]MCZ0809587.1 hypothetical protein [Brevibacillus laterosporus]MCZ0828120.1 hypothetical protein [Brevibacillus laterosporus]MCZ0852142.1 hypothetical protein [Brevibacillus laterosporus]